MAIIVNKEEKRRNIALSCRELLLKHGINSLTIAQIAKTAGVGKGTMYEYFDNKEDIVFEIIATFIEEHEKKLLALVSQSIPTKEKLFHFYYLIFEDEISRQHLSIYQEFLAISLTNGTEEMERFSERCKMRFMMILDQILEEGIKSGDVERQMPFSSSSLLLFMTGLVVDSRLATCDAKREINIFLDILLPSNKKENR